MPPQGHIRKDGSAGCSGDRDHHRRRVDRGFGAAKETLPARFGYASSDLDNEEVQATETGPQVRFTLQWDSPSTYIVNAPSEEGVYSFSGMLRDSDRKDTPVGGPSWERATVQQPSNPGPCALPEQLAHLSCGGGDRLGRGHRRIHAVIDDNYPAGASRPFRERGV